MNPTETAADSSLTPIAVLLNSMAAPPRMAAYRGALSPLLLDAPAREWSAATGGSMVHDLGWLRRVAVKGEDRFRWLNGMVTNSVQELAAGSGAWNLVLNAQGRIQGELHVWRLGNEAGTDGSAADQLELEIAADQYEKLLAHLDRFIIMDDVELVPLTEQTAVGLAGPHAAEVLARLGLPAPGKDLTSAEGSWEGRTVQVRRGYGALVPHFELWLQATEVNALWPAMLEAGAVAAGSETLEALRVAEAIPAYGVDMVERDLPQETAQLRALHFTKGCYLGQEIVERIRSRGSVHRHLRQLELDGPLPEAGTELTFENGAGEKAVAGQITSAVELPLTGTGRRVALAMIRGEAELRKQSFVYTAGAGTGTARILAAPADLALRQSDLHQR
jgi:folate-binding protein YgfZ